MPLANRTYRTKEGLYVHDAGEEGVREQQSEYRLLKDVFKDRPCGGVWDVGAHVGWFAWYATRWARPERILCVECAPRQLSVLRRNVPPVASVLAGALVADDDPRTEVELYLGKTYSSCDSTYDVVKGRKCVTVSAVRYADLSAALPDPEVVKLDCEGAEYCTVPSRHFPDSVRVVLAEFHWNRPGQEDQLHELDAAITEVGFRRVKPAELVTEGKWKKTVHVSYLRD